MVCSSFENDSLPICFGSIWKFPKINRIQSYWVESNIESKCKPHCIYIWIRFAMSYGDFWNWKSSRMNGEQQWAMNNSERKNNAHNTNETNKKVMTNNEMEWNIRKYLCKSSTLSSLLFDQIFFSIRNPNSFNFVFVFDSVCDKRRELNKRLLRLSEVNFIFILCGYFVSLVCCECNTQWNMTINNYLCEKFIENSAIKI